jgi:trypanothione synthetase/amidase
MAFRRIFVIVGIISCITDVASKEFVTPFGTELGVYDGVIGYSNGNDENISTELNFIGKIFTGLKWQCVEYARRWLVLKRELSFDGVEGAEDIWFLNHFLSVKDETKFKMLKTENGAIDPPSKNSIIIWKRSEPNPFGHVAVVSEVNKEVGFVKVAEQNVMNDYWPGEYARELKLKFREGKWYIEDEDPLFGWIDVGSATQ